MLYLTDYFFNFDESGSLRLLFTRYCLTLVPAVELEFDFCHIGVPAVVDK